ATKVFGDLSERTVVVLGAGETGTLFAEQASAAGVRDVRVANRTGERSDALARRLEATTIAWADLRRALPEAGVVVGATPSPSPVVSRSDVEAAMRERRGRPMFFLDLAMPRDFEPGVADLYNVYVFGLDDLGAVADENRRRRSREIPVAETIL